MASQIIVLPRSLFQALLSVQVKLLDALEAVICASASFTAHQVLRFAHAFNEARGLPAIGPEPVVLRHPRSNRLRRLRMLGLALTRDHAERLAEIDRQLAPYAERMRTADLDQCIATLSAQGGARDPASLAAGRRQQSCLSRSADGHSAQVARRCHARDGEPV